MKSIWNDLGCRYELPITFGEDGRFGVLEISVWHVPFECDEGGAYDGGWSGDGEESLPLAISELKYLGFVDEDAVAKRAAGDKRAIVDGLGGKRYAIATDYDLRDPDDRQIGNGVYASFDEAVEAAEAWMAENLAKTM